MKTFGKVLLVTGTFVAGCLSGAYFMYNKMKKEQDEIIEAEVNDVRDHYKKKEKELNDEKELIRKQRCKELIEEYKLKAEKDEDPGYPCTEQEIEEYNFDNDLYKELEFITEEEYQYDEDTNHTKLECRMFNDGSVITSAGIKVSDDELGNMCSGMGVEDCLRYVRNWETKTDFCIEYFDEEPREGEE